MAALSVLQWNAGRGREACTLMKERAKEQSVDVVLIQEPQARVSAWDGYKRHGVTVGGKVEVWVKEGIESSTIGDLETGNVLGVRVEGIDGAFMVFVCVYDEPGGIVNRRMESVERLLGRLGNKVLVAGDFNAKNEAWGGMETDARGESLLLWAIGEGYMICNDRDSRATFSSTRGESWVDVTMAKGLRVNEWDVEDEETLSDHRYVRYRVEWEVERKSRYKWVMDLANTDWRVIVERVREYVEGEMGSAEELEMEVERFQGHCERVCKRSIRRRRRTVWGENEWWDRELNECRRRVRARRREWQRANDIDEKMRTLEALRVTRREYKNKIRGKKLQSIREGIDHLCETNSWDRVWEVIRKKGVRVGQKGLRREDGSYVYGPREVSRELIARYHPGNDIGQYEESVRYPRARRKTQERTEYDVVFSKYEVECVIGSLKKGKATAGDRIPYEAVRYIWEGKGDFLCKLYNRCWQLGVFPKIWKKADIVWLPKDKGGYRPISLLPTLGKLLDKLVNGRLSNWCEREHVWSQNQFGFRAGMDAVLAIETVIRRVTEEREKGWHSLVVALDLKNAFNMAWPVGVDRQLSGMNAPGGLREICWSFMNDRVVSSGGETVMIDKGCPQGSSLGPSLWIINMEGWFERMGRLRVELNADLWVQAFADDQILIVSASSVKLLEDAWERAWEECQAWARSECLIYNEEKTECMFVEARGRIRGPVVRMGEARLHVSGTLDYLGVRLDPKFSFIEHVKNVRRKAGALVTKLQRIAASRGRMNKEIIGLVYERVVKPALLYGAGVWGKRAKDTRVIRQLQATQRLFLLAMARAYRTTPTAALQVLMGKVPLYLEAYLTHETRRRYGADWYGSRVNEGNRVYPGQRVDVGKVIGGVDVEVYVDASMRGEIGGVGCLVRQRDRSSLEGFRFEGICTTVEAELAGLDFGVKFLEREGEFRRAVVISDSVQALRVLGDYKTSNKLAVDMQNRLVTLLSQGRVIGFRRSGDRDKDFIGVVHREANRIRREPGVGIDIDGLHTSSRREALTLQKVEEIRQWQESWDREVSGRLVYEWVRGVGRQGVGLSFKGTQLLTGHGNMRSYLRRFNLGVNVDDCECGRGVESAHHILWECTIDRRVRARLEAERRVGRGVFQLRTNGRINEEAIVVFNEWAEAVVDDTEIE